MRLTHELVRMLMMIKVWMEMPEFRAGGNMNMRRGKQIFIILGISILLIGCGNKNPNTDQISGNTELTVETVETFSSTEKTTTEKATIQETTPPVPYNQELLPYITIKDGFTVADYGESAGTDYSYAVYRLSKGDSSDRNMEMYWEVVVLDNEHVVTVLSIENEEYGSAFPSPAELVLECDVNFDGIHDILLCLGHFGSQGLVTYKCFLSDGETLTYCPSFTDIANPAIDYDGQVVRSQWRNMATSHGWGIYTFQDNAFTMTECFTESETQDESGTYLWTWTDEVFKDGQWQIREYYTEHDYDAETIYHKHYGPDSYWGLDQDKWNTLFNGGKMSDFSIYAD